MTITSLNPRHGGDLAMASATYGAPENGWLDLSTGINPVPYPVAMESVALERLPASDALTALNQAARVYGGAPGNAAVVPLAGSELAIRQLPHLIPCEKVAIVSPTYSSHLEAWSETGCEIAPVPELDLVPGDADVVVVANPNNPDGRSVAVDPLVAMADRLSKRGGALVVDEAFGDLTPQTSLLPYIDRVPVIVLRSFGKFFGLPGLRLGFCFGPDEFLERLAARIGDWPVSSLAVEVGRQALEDTDWQNETRRRLAAAREALDACLLGHGIEVTGGTDLFRLATRVRGPVLHAHLARQGILTRVFAERPEWVRFGIPVGPEDLARLSAALLSFNGE